MHSLQVKVPLHPPPKHEVPTLSHLVHSLSQLDTRLVGHTMMTRRAKGGPPPGARAGPGDAGGPPSSSWPFWSSVQRSVMPCRVLPKPCGGVGG